MSTNKRTKDKQPNKGVYLDCNATTPLEPAVREEMLHYLDEEYGNEGSRTHEYGNTAKQAVQRAREQIASLVRCQREEVIFTSGATEANNIALLGFAAYGEKVGKRHIISTQIEHKAVLEPLQELERRGFEITLLPPEASGQVKPEDVVASLRSDTLLVSVMHANNETGVIQPIEKIASLLTNTDVFFHVDAAQTFGKIPQPLQNPRIDFISLSGHKIYGPKGVGALVTRRRGYERAPLTPLMYGGGQERGLRPGTLPVPQIVGLGVATALAAKHHGHWDEINRKFKMTLISELSSLNPIYNGDQSSTMSHCISLAFPGVDSESLIVALKGIVSISNGSACTSATYKASHVLEAMRLSSDIISGTIRLSWCHLTPPVKWEEVVNQIEALSSLSLKN